MRQEGWSLISDQKYSSVSMWVDMAAGEYELIWFPV